MSQREQFSSSFYRNIHEHLFLPSDSLALTGEPSIYTRVHQILHRLRPVSSSHPAQGHYSKLERMPPTFPVFPHWTEVLAAINQFIDRPSSPKDHRWCWGSLLVL